MDNASFILANPHNLLASATTKYDKFLFIKSNGEEVDQEKGDKLLSIAMQTVECFKDEIGSYRGSLGSFIIEKYKLGLVRKYYFA